MGTVHAFRRPPKRCTVPSDKRRVVGFAVALQARQDAVFLVTDEVELGLSPAQARQLAVDLLDMADSAEAHRG